MIRRGRDVPPRLTREVDAATGRVTIRGEGGAKGDWPKELNARRLEPNADYHVNGYHHATDAEGRVTSAQGKLDPEVADRNGYQQRVSGREDRLPANRGGHLIASIFNGPGDRLDLVAMNGNYNMGAWRSMEAGFEAALKEGKSGDVRVDVIYAEGQRPSKFLVQARIDGQPETADRYRNRGPLPAPVRTCGADGIAGRRLLTRDVDLRRWLGTRKRDGGADAGGVDHRRRAGGPAEELADTACILDLHRHLVRRRHVQVRRQLRGLT